MWWCLDVVVTRHDMSTEREKERERGWRDRGEVREQRDGGREKDRDGNREKALYSYKTLEQSVCGGVKNRVCVVCQDVVCQDVVCQDVVCQDVVVIRHHVNRERQRKGQRQAEER